MNPRPTPHIGTTLAQRAILRYRLEQRELEAERERLERTTAALQVDALMDRIREHDASGCAECDDVPEPAPLDTTNGIMPATNATVVMRIGRSRSVLAWMMAWRVGSPRAFN